MKKVMPALTKPHSLGIAYSPYAAGLLLTVIIVLCASSGWSRKVSVSLEVENGTDTLIFDDTKISESIIRQAMLFSPNGPYPGSESIIRSNIESCLDDDPAYKPCGDRTIASPNFIANAEVNIRRTEELLVLINASQLPPELAAVKTFCLEQTEFRLAMARNKLEYFKSWDLKVLYRPYRVDSLAVTLEPDKLCPVILSDLNRTASPFEKYRIAGHEWHNCMNKAFVDLDSRRLYPKGAWRSFLKKYDISEKFVFDEP